MSKLCVSAWFQWENLNRMVKASPESSKIFPATSTMRHGTFRFTLGTALAFTNLGSIVKIDNPVSHKQRNLTIFPAPGQINKNSMMGHNSRCGSGKRFFPRGSLVYSSGFFPFKCFVGFSDSIATLPQHSSGVLTEVFRLFPHPLRIPPTSNIILSSLPVLASNCSWQELSPFPFLYLPIPPRGPAYTFLARWRTQW